MRVLVVLALLVGATRLVAAQPLRVTIQCENPGRTKACPAFLLGLVDAHKVLLQSPRAVADVIVYANATEVALVDRIHLRFVASIPGAPPFVEIDADLDSRADDDTQRAQLESAFLRGMALYVGARFPALVTVKLDEPAGEAARVKHVSPWDLALDLNGWGNWVGEYQSYGGSANANVARVETRKRFGAFAWGGGGLDRRPPLRLDDGTLVSTNVNNWYYGGQLEGAWLYNHRYSMGASTSTWRDDPKGQFRYGWDAKLGLQWDRYRADDPRGNRLAIAYIFAYRVEGYNLRNDIGEIWAHYPTHKLQAVGSLRRDKVSVGLSFQVGGEVLHPMRRHTIAASPSIQLIGDHLDIGLSFSVTKRELPAPDASQIDPKDFAQLSRLSYAEPFAVSGSFNVRIHWDRTNGQRNDRLAEL